MVSDEDRVVLESTARSRTAARDVQRADRVDGLRDRGQSVRADQIRRVLGVGAGSVPKCQFKMLGSVPSVFVWLRSPSSNAMRGSRPSEPMSTNAVCQPLADPHQEREDIP